MEYNVNFHIFGVIGTVLQQPGQGVAVQLSGLQIPFQRIGGFLIWKR